MSAKEQKIKLYEILTELNIGTVEKEKDFEWANISSDINERNITIYNVLKDYRGYTQFNRNGKIKFDFVIDDCKLIIEYDERQHFSIPRKISLKNYPSDIELFYNKDEWINRCEEIHAKDNDPIYRDEQRAYRDSIRDIEAYKNGYKLLRIYENEYDFENNIDQCNFMKRVLLLIHESD